MQDLPSFYNIDFRIRGSVPSQYSAPYKNIRSDLDSFIWENVPRIYGKRIQIGLRAVAPKL